jgi:hypothetical protein
MADVVMIRPLHATDRGQWETLWRGYLDFYRADLGPRSPSGPGQHCARRPQRCTAW